MQTQQQYNVLGKSLKDHPALHTQRHGIKIPSPDKDDRSLNSDTTRHGAVGREQIVFGIETKCYLDVSKAMHES